jgi:hypothetical protein
VSWDEDFDPSERERNGVEGERLKKGWSRWNEPMNNERQKAE